MRPGIPFLSLVLLCSVPEAHLDAKAGGTGPVVAASTDRSGSSQAPLVASSRKQASRLLLEFRFRELRNRCDSLWGDSLLVSLGELPRFRRALQAANKVLAETENRLGELRRTESGKETKRWESLRARVERAIYGLERYLSEAEVVWFPARAPGSYTPETRENGL